MLKSVNRARAAGRAVAVITDLADGRDRVVEAGQPVPGELGVAIADAFGSGTARLVTVGGRPFFINIHPPSDAGQG
ncbi:hypothetical protein [Roseitalea porphyridii]|uniref:Uncharacterized protein n=1 Tax=Roseitalea porphyridii TaxID=1852022 RepID=A0A4P6V2N4_9HYPH|nr:hypothetical protein [Roseitalea porphyridii]QBK30949.1 hypothetical protein E0E05_10315 [Roseitalea porphyridii]